MEIFKFDENNEMPAKAERNFLDKKVFQPLFFEEGGKETVLSLTNCPDENLAELIFKTKKELKEALNMDAKDDLRLYLNYGSLFLTGVGEFELNHHVNITDFEEDEEDFKSSPSFANTGNFVEEIMAKFEKYGKLKKVIKLTKPFDETTARRMFELDAKWRKEIIDGYRCPRFVLDYGFAFSMDSEDFDARPYFIVAAREDEVFEGEEKNIAKCISDFLNYLINNLPKDIWSHLPNCAGE